MKSFFDRLLNIGVEEGDHPEVVRRYRMVNGLNIFYAVVSLSGLGVGAILGSTPLSIMQLIFSLVYVYGLVLTRKHYLRFAQHLVIYVFELQILGLFFFSARPVEGGYYFSESLIFTLLYPLLAAVVEVSIPLHLMITIFEVSVAYFGSRILRNFLFFLSPMMVGSGESSIVFLRGITLVYIPIMSAILVGLLRRENTRAKESLSESEKAFREIFEGSEDTLFTIDPGTKNILGCNQKAIDMFGFVGKEEVLGSMATKLIPEEVFVQLKIVRRQVVLTTSKGRSFWADIVVKEIVVGGKNILLVRIADVNDIRTAEAELQKKNEELEEMNKLMVGRETRMAEMRKEMETLRTMTMKA